MSDWTPEDPWTPERTNDPESWGLETVWADKSRPMAERIAAFEQDHPLEAERIRAKTVAEGTARVREHALAVLDLPLSGVDDRKMRLAAEGATVEKACRELTLLSAMRRRAGTTVVDPLFAERRACIAEGLPVEESARRLRLAARRLLR